MKIDLVNFFNQKTEDFDESGIVSLAERCQQIWSIHSSLTILFFY